MSNVFVFRRPPHGVITEYFGGGKGGSTTTTNNVTQIPPEVLARYNAVNARAETVAQAPYQSYSQDPNAFVAPLSQTQQAGIQNTNAMAGAAQPYYGAATGLAAQSTGSVNPSALNVGQYMNPFTQSVVNATQAAMNQQQGQQLSQQQADAIRGGAFGGERAGLQRAQLQGQQSLAQAQAIAPLYQQNYNQALAAAQQQQGVGLGAEQANRQNLQNAATLFGSIGTNAQQAGLAGAQAQLAAGQTQQQTQQAGLQALYNQFQQQQGFPYQQAQFLANIAEGTGALSGNATSGTSTTTGGGGFFSDERLKENIQRVGETDDGQPIYRYNYKGDKNTQIGLLAQDVEKHHPEAVGLAGGYKTVNYKKATEDAVHKDGGGEVSGTDAYSIGAPSAMLRENSGKGLGAAPSLPQAFQGGRDIPIEAGANAAGLAAMRSPAVTGFAPGVREGKQAELASLQSSIANPGPNSNLLGSGPEYLQSRVNTLQDWLNQNNSQGGLVGPQGGSFARGGLADGGYMNPALAYYSPQQAQQGVFQLQPAGQHQILRGDQMQAPQQRQQPDAITSANQMAGLVGNLNSAYKARPDFLRSAEDVKARAQTADAIKAKEILDIAKARKLDETGGDGYGSPEEGDDFARGGYAGKGYVNPYGGLGGGNDILGPIIEQQDTSLRIPGDKGTPAPSSKPQQSGGLGELAQMANTGKNLYKGGEWAVGKLGLGKASPTAMSATSTEALPGVAGGVVPEAVAPVVPEAVTAAAPEALAAAAPEALAAAAPVVEASVADFLPFLFLKRGGVVPRRHFDGTDGSYVDPEDVGGGDTTATGGDDQTTTVGRTDPNVRPAPRVREPEAPRARDPGVASSYLPDFSKIVPEGAKDTLSSENFWVPAIAGLGAMLASPNKTLAGAIGSGLVGGTGAYTGLQKQQSEIAKNSLDIFNKVFEKREDGDGNISYMNLQTGKIASPQEAFSFLKKMPGFSNLSGSSSAPAKEPAPNDATVSLAKDVVGAGTEQITPRAPIAPKAPTIAAASPAATTPVTPSPVAAAPAIAAPTTATAEDQSIARVPDAAKAEIFRIDQELRAHPEVASQLEEAKKQSAIADRAQAALKNPLSEEARKIRAKQFDEANKQAQDARSRAETILNGFKAPIYANLAKRFDLTPDMIEAAARAEEAKKMAGIPALRATKDIEREYVEQTGPGGGKFLLPPGQILQPPAAQEPSAEQRAAPAVAKVDSATGQLTLARPVAPVGGGKPPTPNYNKGTRQIEQTDAQKAKNVEDGEFIKDFAEKLPNVSQARQRYESLIDAFKLFKSGPTTNQAGPWAAFAQTFGYDELAKQIAGGDVAAIERVQKIAPNLVLETLKAAQPKFAQAEFTTLNNKGVPEPGKLPDVNFGMVRDGLAVLNRSEAFIHAWNRAQLEEGWTSPSAYYVAWSTANPLKAFERAAELQMGNFAGMPLPTEPVAGVTYVAPENMAPKQAAAFAKIGIKPGDPFHYDGAGNITPVPRRQLYSPSAEQ